MKRFLLVVSMFLPVLLMAPFSASAKTSVSPKEMTLSPKVLQASSVYVDCVCPRALAAAKPRGLQQLQSWGRFQIVESVRESDLVILFSGNPYLGDLLTRDGPDKRPVFIESTIMTVIDARTGQALWSDSRQWGSWRVDGAAKSLVEEFRELVSSQTTNWTLNDLLMCSVTPAYQGFDHMTPQQAMQADPHIAPVPGNPNRLRVASSEAPRFCESVELIVGPDNTINGFEVSASRASHFDVNEVVRHADLFDFAGGKYSNGDQVYFSATKKDKKMQIQFGVEGHQSVLASVSYWY
jgi:hypothetical protein